VTGVAAAFVTCTPPFDGGAALRDAGSAEFNLSRRETIMSRLKGKRCLVTGGSSGIGLETARQFIAEGARVAITGSEPKSLEEAGRTLGKDVLVIQSDAGDVAAQKPVSEAVRNALGGLDVLFINAGVADFRPLDAWDEAGFDRSFAVNVKGPFFLIQALLPVFAKPASIILNTSINAHIGMANSSIYGASKGALQTLIRTLTGELIGRSIRVNARQPRPHCDAAPPQARDGRRSDQGPRQRDPRRPPGRSFRSGQGGRVFRLG
jgi:NAD(P)-dependent dehydrogenase (short-subunit alcohol dehydrogenase family)